MNMMSPLLLIMAVASRRSLQELHKRDTSHLITFDDEYAGAYPYKN
jgi:hypothetical protein